MPQATLEPPSTLVPVDQTITFGPLPNKMYGDAPFTGVGELGFRAACELRHGGWIGLFG